MDDGRQGTSTVPSGYRYNKDKKEFEYTEAYEIEDKRRKLEGESENQRMARVCLEVMNSINKDLSFTWNAKKNMRMKGYLLWILVSGKKKEGSLTTPTSRKG